MPVYNSFENFNYMEFKTLNKVNDGESARAQ